MGVCAWGGLDGCAGGGGDIGWVYMGDINIPHSMQRHMGTAIDGNHPTSLDEYT